LSVSECIYMYEGKDMSGHYLVMLIGGGTSNHDVNRHKN
jgi:hypothetical protein